MHLRASVLPMSKGKRGPVDQHQGKPRSPQAKPKGMDTKGIHPTTRKTGNVKMNKLGKGADRSKQKAGVLGTKPKSIEGEYF